MYTPEEYFISIETKPIKERKAKIREIVLNKDKSALIRVTLENKICDTLVDTGATRCFMKEDFYNSLENKPPLLEVFGMNVSTASGENIGVKGMVRCSFRIGTTIFTQRFVVCKGIKRPLILGLNFLRKHQVGTTWSLDGKFFLQRKDKVLIESLETFFKEEKPKIITKSQVDIPGRSLVVITPRVHLAPEHCDRIYDTQAVQQMMDEYPDLVSIPMIHKTSQREYNTVPYILVNTSYDHIILDKGMVIAELIPIEETLNQMTTQSYMEINEVQVDCTLEEGEEMKTILKHLDTKDKRFITSPADIEVHRKTDLLDAPVSEKDKEKFRELCQEFDEVFSKSSEDIGRTPLVTMDIDTGDHPPICQKPYNLALKHVEWVHKELDILEKAGVIVRSVSPWASPIVIVPKKSEPGEPPKRRMCVDYRMLNKLLTPVKKVNTNAKGVRTLVPLPKIDEIYAKLRGAHVFSALDMRSGYHHIALSKESQPKTAFVVGGPQGAKFEFKVVPFGLTQAPAYFQRLVGEVLQGIPYAFGYLDDILIFSPDVETHLEHLREIFKRLKKADLKLKESKCSFLKAHIQYLGHLISGQGIEPVPEKLETIKEMPSPTTPKEVRRFLGMVGYYRKFIPKYSDIARPLTNLTRKDMTFEWTEVCQHTFEMLKNELTKEPILKYPDPGKPYTIFTDASKYAWACILTQEYIYEQEGKEHKVLHPITYASGLFRGSQLNWATLTKEAFAIYMSIKKLTYYLEDAEVTLRSDHLPLKKFLEKNTLNTKVNNWAIEMTSCARKIHFEYIKGIKNTLADTMSRLIKITPEIELHQEPEGEEYGYDLFQPLEPIKTKRKNKIRVELDEIKDVQDPIPEEKIHFDLTEKEIIEIQKRDRLCNQLIKNVQQDKQTKTAPYFLENEVLKRHVTDNKQRFDTTVVTKGCAPLLLKLAHDESGHNGSARTYMILRRLYFWKGMKSQIYQYVKQCKVCQQHNIIPVKYTKGHFEVPKSPMEFISMDLIGEFNKSSRGNVYALTVICMLTGFTFCIPIENKTASTVVQAYIDNVYNKFGGSRKILSDNGTEFKNKLFTQIATELGVEYKCYSPPYHPQSNGRIEGFHHFLKTCMAKHIRENKEWDELTQMACAAYNFFPNEHSKESPFFLMFGRDPRIPLNQLLTPKLRYLGEDENVLSLEALKRIYHLIAQNLKIARAKMDKEKKIHPSKLNKGDLIMIKTHSKKQFDPKYKGYYRIICFKGNQVEIMPQSGGTTHMVHISDVKYIMPVDSIIQHLPDFNQYGRKTKYNISPAQVSDLKWQLATTLNTNFTTTLTSSQADPKTITTTTLNKTITNITPITVQKGNLLPQTTTE